MLNCGHPGRLTNITIVWATFSAISLPKSSSDEAECEVDTGGYAARSPDRAVANENAVASTRMREGCSVSSFAAAQWVVAVRPISCRAKRARRFRCRKEHTRRMAGARSANHATRAFWVSSHSATAAGFEFCRRAKAPPETIKVSPQYR